MQFIYNKILLYSVVFIFFLSSAACNLAKVEADDSSKIVIRNRLLIIPVQVLYRRRTRQKKNHRN
jgi:hypothetical protein